MKTATLQKLLLFWAYFVGIGAIVGSLMMFIDSSGETWGMEPILPLLRDRLPMFKGFFNNFIASGIVLLLVNGLPNAISAVLLHRKSALASLNCMICGIILMGWTLFELFIFRDIVFLVVIYFIFGFLQMITALWLMKRPSK